MADEPDLPPTLAVDLPPGALVVSWVAAVEWIGADGKLQLSTRDSPELPWWRRSGMLEALNEVGAWTPDGEPADEEPADEGDGE
jgi:hypothetical protein